MSDSTTRFIFAALCSLCLVAVWCGALFEIGRQKRGATISKRHFRWRLISAALWTLILSLFLFATLRFWPQNAADKVNVSRFAPLVSSAITLMLPAFALLAFDFYLTAQTRRLQTARMNQDLVEVARRNLESAKLEAEAKAQLKREQNREDGGDS